MHFHNLSHIKTWIFHNPLWCCGTKPPNKLQGKIDTFESFSIWPQQEMNSSFFSFGVQKTLLHIPKHFDVWYTFDSSLLLLHIWQFLTSQSPFIFTKIMIHKFKMIFINILRIITNHIGKIFKVYQFFVTVSSFSIILYLVIFYHTQGTKWMILIKFKIMMI
jgi:hypothetical protein